MKKSGYGLSCLAVCLALCSVCIVLADNEAGDREGDCYLENERKNDLECTDMKTDSNGKVYVEEQTQCYGATQAQCMMCIGGEMQEVDCSETPKKRRKRWFWGRRRRRSPPPPPPPPPNSRPTIDCPSVSTVTAPPSSDSAVVTWSQPYTSDREGGTTLSLTSAKASGSSFGEGTHTVSYKVVDNGGLSNTCSFSFDVKVIKCSGPPNISKGVFQCATTVGTVLGTKCTYTCNSGYEISGSATIQCQSNGNFTSSPTCKKISCGDPPLPSNAKSSTCSEGHLYQSICSPVCEQGYLPGRGARLFCPANKKWQPTSWTCIDEVEPVFNNCPTKKIMTIDENYRYPINATDNTGKVTVEQVQGTPEGTPLDFGSHLFKYVASDPTGNEAHCDIVIDMKATDCPVPTSEDEDVEFNCNGMTASSVCQLSCASKARVEGSEYISCVRDETGNNTSRWEPLQGAAATCHKASCPTLNSPKNGALLCDKQQGGTFCQIQCNEFYDVTYSEGNSHTFVCDDNTGDWQPRKVAPDCEELSFPDYYSLPSDYYYYVGDCSDEDAVNTIKQQFIENLNSMGLSPCMGDVCSVEDVELSCGDMEDLSDFDFRRKRSTSSTGHRILHVKVKIRVQNENGTLSPAAADTLMKDLAHKSKEVMSTNTALRTMLYQSLPKSSNESGDSKSPTLPEKVKSFLLTGNVTLDCAAGRIPTHSDRCVSCAIGSYADKGSCKTCPQNTYQNKSGSISCEPCPAHHTTLSTGAVSRDECQELCQIDEFSPTGRAPCFPCPDEEQQPKIGSTTCLPCPGFHIVGPVSLKCLYRTFKPKNDTVVPDQFRVSNYLLTCEEEICLKF